MNNDDYKWREIDFDKDSDDNNFENDFETDEVKSEEYVKKNVEYIEENLWEKLERVGKKISFTKDIKALYNYFRNADVSWYRKAIIIGALIYFITPIDAVPDLAPLFGYLDDLGVITAVLKFLGSELIPYYKKS
ncbi:MAG: hypothetical protein STSR0008_08850 [Ignavibacterium sp.]